MAGAYQVTISTPAQKDLKEILLYLALEKGSVQSAKKVRQTILDAVQGLSQMPQRHSLVKEVFDKSGIAYRRVIAGKSYRIIYYVDEEASEVFVVRILHVKRSPDFIRNVIE
jgi:toxin ParE1/3/4